MPTTRHGFVHQPANSQPTLPLTFYSATTVHDKKCMPFSNGLAGQNKQKVLQVYTVNIYTKKRELQFPQKAISYGWL